MASPAGGTPVEPSLIQRVVAGFRYALTGNSTGAWFGPMQPIPPALEGQEAQTAGVAGRKFDFPVGYNTQIRPRALEAIKFEHLRALADAYDLLRLVIETRKDQMCELPWQVMPKQKGNARPKPTPACEEAALFLMKPDQENDWATWLRLVLEDLFVLDAPAIYCRPALDGTLWGAEPLDGATIKRVIDNTGRTPMEGPAYQQILKGVPAVDYTREELIYRPRNVRTNRVYGFSPVEQIVNTVNIALRRQQFTLDYFTSGTVPDALAGVPESWTTEQIKMFQDYWDALLAGEDGNMAKKRKLRFVPGEIARNFLQTKEPPLKDMFDEWLARITCYCFSIDVTPFVAQVNRSVAETNREQSLLEGLGPTMRWVKGIADELLLRKGFTDLELTWQEGKVVDPEKRMKINTGYVTAKVIHPDEVRADLGLDPLTPEQKEDLNPTPVDPLGAAPPGKPKPKKEGESLGKALRSGGLTAARAQGKIADKLEAFFTRWAKKVGPKLAEYLSLDKAAHHKPQIDDAVARLEWEEWGDLVEEITPHLSQVAVAAGKKSLSTVGALSDAAEATMRDRAEDFARDRAAELVGMKWQHGKLVPNPNAEWRIDETTRDALREIVEEALDNGWSTGKLTNAIEDMAVFSEERAEAIARTEMALADSEGAMAGYKASGIVRGKFWSTSEDDKVSDECQANADAGTIPLDEPFPSGDVAPPAHPNCRCVVLPVLDDE